MSTSSIAPRLVGDDEEPQTEVIIGQGFWMGIYEVTQREYQAVLARAEQRGRICATYLWHLCPGSEQLSQC
jgi:formylglycine-generating enzyme required for sulfatase activity